MLSFLRSIGVIILGYATMCVVIMLSFVVGAKFKWHTTTGGIVLLLALSCVGGAAGGWVTTRLAAQRPRLHAFILALVALALAIVMVIHPDKDAAGKTAPLWFNVALAALVIPATMLGALLCPRKERESTPAKA